MLTIQEVYDELLQSYGKPQWWADNPYQVMVEAVLVQHTTWSSVKKMRPSLKDKLSPVYVQSLQQEALEELIRPCGFQKAKARAIQALTGWFMQYGCDGTAVRIQPLEQLRAELLALHGIGAETADVILVYAFRLPSFIVDAYTRNFLKRLGFSFASDAEIKGFFEGTLHKDTELYGNYHWLILKHCISRCKKTPVCGDCPFASQCAAVAIHP